MLKAIIFDMDGTITRPHIDWKALRNRVGVPEGHTIMAHIENLEPTEASRAEAIVREIELDAAQNAVLNPGVEELLEQLHVHPLKLALVTNNHRQAMEHVVATFGLEFHLLLSREDAQLKPAPDLLELAIRRFGLTTSQVCCVGDGRYDRLASQAAGIRYIHLAHDADEPVDGPTIYSINELWDHLELDDSPQQSDNPNAN